MKPTLFLLPPEWEAGWRLLKQLDGLGFSNGETIMDYSHLRCYPCRFRQTCFRYP